MTREEAIRKLIIIREKFGPILTDIGETMDMAISALREQDKAPCEYCNGTRRRLPIFDAPEVGSFNTILFSEGKAFLEDADGNYIGIRACPMCGRRLEEV